MKCGSTFGMGQKSRFVGDNVMLGTKYKRKEYFMNGVLLEW